MRLISRSIVLLISIFSTWIAAGSEEFLFAEIALEIKKSGGINCIDPGLNRTVAAKLAGIAAEGLLRRYPNIVHHVMNSEADVLPHYLLTPSFSGCYDWHSAVHTTWQLARLIRIYPNESYVHEARRVLRTLLTKENLEKEAEYLSGDGRSGFERPYGLAWFLQLVSELIEWNDSEGNVWRENLVPIEKLAISSISTWLPKLTHPIRIGEHSQTAFAMGLVFDYAVITNNIELRELLKERTLAFHLSDQDCPITYEPSGHDFLSPCIAEADLMRRIVPTSQFRDWLTNLLPSIPTDPNENNWLPPVRASDPSDGKLAHFDGLNLSRAWMLEGIQNSLPLDDPRRAGLEVVIEEHREAGMKTVLGDMDYMGSHWLGSFAVYLSTCRGQQA